MIPFLFGASHRSHTVCLVVSYRSNQVKNLPCIYSSLVTTVQTMRGDFPVNKRFTFKAH